MRSKSDKTHINSVFIFSI